MFYQLKKIFNASVVLFIFSSSTVYAQINVFACEPEWAALTRMLAGDKVNVYSATSALQDPHHIQARPSLIAKVRRADLLVCTGAELEIGWLPLLLRKSGNAAIQTNNVGHFMASNYVSLLEKPKLLDRSLGDVHAAGNPHIHLDPYRILNIAQALSKKLEDIDPSNSATYKKMQLNFMTTWKQSIARWEKKTQVLKGKKIVVSHNTWIYLENWLGLINVATLEAKPGIPPSSTHLSKVLLQLKQNPAEMILYANYQNNKPALWLSKKTGTRAIALPFSVARGDNLIQWYDKLLNQLLGSN